MFIFHIDSIVDIITNSSSELFIMKAEGKDVIIELIESVLPDFRDTYGEPILLKDCSGYELYLYVFYNYTFTGSANEGYGGKKTFNVINGFTFEEMYVPFLELYPHLFNKSYPNYYKNEYELRNNFIEDNRERIIKAVDPHNNIWLMKSLDDNPDNEIYEKLLPIGRRIGAI